MGRRPSVSTAAATQNHGIERGGPAGLPRLLAWLREDGRAEPLQSHVDRYGTVADAISGGALVAEVEASGLAGRGGASFPTAVKLASVVGARRRPVVVANGAEGEPASGKDRALLRTLPHLVLDGAVAVADAVGAQTGGLTGRVSGVLIGGYFGSWVAPDDFFRLRLLDSELATHRAALGARAILALPDDTCAVGELARVTRYLASESAGQCGPCVHGLDAIATAMERLASGAADARPQLERWIEMVRGRGACRHPDGTLAFVESAFDVFGDEIDLHLRYG